MAHSPLHAVVALAITGLLASAAQAGLESDLADSEDAPLSEVFALLEDRVIDLAGRSPYLRRPDHLRSVHGLLLALRQIEAQHRDRLDAPLASLESGARDSILDLAFFLDRLDRAADNDSPSDEIEALERFVKRNFRGKLPEEMPPVLNQQPTALVAPYLLEEILLESRHVDGASTRAAGSRNESDSPATWVPCARLDGGYRCELRAEGGAVRSLRVLDVELKMRQKRWWPRGASERRVRLPIFILPDQIADYRVDYTIKGSRQISVVRTHSFSTWLDAGVRGWTRDKQCIDATPGWTIDPQSIQLASESKNVRVEHLSKISGPRVCAVLATRGQRASSGQGEQSVTLLYLEVRRQQETALRTCDDDEMQAPDCLPSASGTLQFGGHEIVPLPSGAVGFQCTITLHDGTKYKIDESTLLPGIRVDVLRDRLELHAADAPVF